MRKLLPLLISLMYLSLFSFSIAQDTSEQTSEELKPAAVAALSKLSDEDFQAVADFVNTLSDESFDEGFEAGKDATLKAIIANPSIISGVTSTAPTTTASTIESKIDGEFEGWDGETIFKLTNGQIWQQSSYAYTYHYAYRPDVLIYKSGSQWKMRVDGVNDEINVERLQ